MSALLCRFRLPRNPATCEGLHPRPNITLSIVILFLVSCRVGPAYCLPCSTSSPASAAGPPAILSRQHRDSTHCCPHHRSLLQHHRPHTSSTLLTLSPPQKLRRHAARRPPRHLRLCGAALTRAIRTPPAWSCWCEPLPLPLSTTAPTQISRAPTPKRQTHALAPPSSLCPTPRRHFDLFNTLRLGPSCCDYSVHTPVSTAIQLRLPDRQRALPVAVAAACSPRCCLHPYWDFDQESARGSRSRAGDNQPEGAWRFQPSGKPPLHQSDMPAVAEERRLRKGIGTCWSW
jgi:hypothetical protein